MKSKSKNISAPCYHSSKDCAFEISPHQHRIANLYGHMTNISSQLIREKLAPAL